MNQRKTTNDRKNHEGYTDTVPYEVDRIMAKEYERMRKLINVIRYICDLSGFEIQGRIVLKDKNSGRVWR